MFNIEEKKFGVEIEFDGIDIQTAASALCDALETTVSSMVDKDGSAKVPGGYFEILDKEGRTWKMANEGADLPSGNQKLFCELITPPLTFGQIHILEKILKLLVAKGAIVTRHCGLHVHVDFLDFIQNNDHIPTLKVLHLFATYEDKLYSFFKVKKSREKKYVQKLKHFHGDVFKNLSGDDEMGYEALTCLTHLMQRWTKGAVHYWDQANSKHSGVNIYNLKYGGKYSTPPTIEMRLFNSTLDYETVRFYVEFTLRFIKKALEMEFDFENLSPRSTKMRNDKIFSLIDMGKKIG